MYLSDLIGEKFKDWEKKKVLITAPTGLGKTTFILNVLLPYLQEHNKKMLILCNRKLLRAQYVKDLVFQFNHYDDIEKSVDLKTYQQFYEEIGDKENLKKIFIDYECIVLDECHYFYADSDFNGSGTFSLLQKIIYAGITKNMIFLSATMDEVEILIRRTIKNCAALYRNQEKKYHLYDGCSEVIRLDYSWLGKYDRFQCLSVPDEETLCGLIAKSVKKTLFFIDNKEKAFELQRKLYDMGLKNKDVAVLNANVLDGEKNNPVVRELVINHKMLPKVLITTAVLDNGVSIQDEDVGNLVILTESKVSFLQMVGRLREESTQTCNVIFLLRNSNVFERRMNLYKSEIDQFEELEKRNPTLNANYYWHEIINRRNPELLNFYSKALVFDFHDLQYFKLREGWAYGRYGERGLYVNLFAKKKIEELYFMEEKMFYLAEQNPLEVVYYQMSWLGKGKEELQIYDSDYKQERKDDFFGLLLSVKGYSLSQLIDVKNRLVKEYRKDFFGDIKANNGSLSAEKLKEICQRYDLRVIEGKNKDGTKIYSIVRMCSEDASKEEG